MPNRNLSFSKSQMSPEEIVDKGIWTHSFIQHTSVRCLLCASVRDTAFCRKQRNHDDEAHWSWVRWRPVCGDKADEECVMVEEGDYFLMECSEKAKIWRKLLNGNSIINFWEICSVNYFFCQNQDFNFPKYICPDFHAFLHKSLEIEFFIYSFRQVTPFKDGLGRKLCLSIFPSVVGLQKWYLL